MNDIIKSLYMEALKYRQVLNVYYQEGNTYHIVAVNPGTPIGYHNEDRAEKDRVLNYYPYREYTLEPNDA